MPFAQLVIGPPGAGKSTYCDGAQQFFNAIDRQCSVVNLDPANDRVTYPCALDIRDLVPLEEVMEQEELGPNGGVLYALEELEHNWTWMEDGLKELKEDYLIIDCPGQVELFTHHTSLPSIFHRLEGMGYRLIVIQLLDAHTLTRPTLYISSLLLSLRSMLNLPYPCINVLSKIDNLSRNEPLPFNLDFYTEVQDLSQLLPHLEAEQAGITLSTLSSDPTIDPVSILEQIRARDGPDAGGNKWTKLNEALIQLIDDFGLVSFQPLAVEDKASMMSLTRAVDRASGFVFGADGKGALSNEESVFATVMKEGWGQMDIKDVQERWIDRREEFDEMERKGWEEEAREAGAMASVGEQVVDVPGKGLGNPPTVEEVEAATREKAQLKKSRVGVDDDDDDEDLDALQEEFLAKTRQGQSAGAKVVKK
ncbi:GPN-loop GTPase 2 [Sphaceloma murrayae]|uniref:GPN-loop GTPase 2 n=1 Tax=Sphaceloma murrayae TaxID=2082308 RepID=A0A2K1QV20_9PEZI|nr:GPN-loop GTPase 2 [Sphaceloma murrayae]